MLNFFRHVAAFFKPKNPSVLRRKRGQKRRRSYSPKTSDSEGDSRRPRKQSTKHRSGGSYNKKRRQRRSDAYLQDSDSSTASDSLEDEPDTEKPCKTGVNDAYNENVQWDGWPDGDFERTFSHAELKTTKQAQVHWACITSGLQRLGGSADAEDWKDGRQSERRCQGVIQCDNPHCSIVVRPKVSHTGIEDQIACPCTCGGQLSRSEPRCPARQRLHKFKHGVHFVHTGAHNHLRPTHLLHLRTDEEAAFTRLVTDHPKAGPLELVIGAQTLRGPGPPASAISPALLNKDRVKYEQRKIKQNTIAASGGGGDQFISTFTQFCHDHPGFVLQSVIGNITLISVQTATLRSQLIKDHALSGADANVNGIVSDAAHGFWRDHSALLIVSSTFSPDLRCWVPGLLSYSNGASTEHYRLHFLALFQSISHEAHLRNHPINDSLFANVVDFSEAERAGFIEAFVEFWRREGTTRTADDLRASAGKLLKGCQQHFRAGVTRIKRTGGIIPLGQAANFEKMAHNLLKLPDAESFQAQGRRLLKHFPEVAPWLEWWLRDSHAPMLFAPYRNMDASLWVSLPDTTNAEEAMHWKIYSGIGTDQTLMSGLTSLYAFAGYYERLLAGASVGNPIRYGHPEPWKETFQRIGRTKASRDPQSRKQAHRYRNDGRPPDTRTAMFRGKKHKAASKLRLKLDKKLRHNEQTHTPAMTSPPLDHATVRCPPTCQTTSPPKMSLFPPSDASSDEDSLDLPPRMRSPTVQMGIAPAATVYSTAAQGEQAAGSSTLRALPAYSQAGNSCWLDVSLQALYISLSNDFHSFDERFRGAVLPETLLYELYSCLDLRRTVQSEAGGQNNNPQYLSLQRDTLHRKLFEHSKPIIRTLTSMENIFAWLGELLRSSMLDETSHFALAYFMGYSITIRSCNTAGQAHFQVSACPRPVFYHQLDSALNLRYDGSVAVWAKSLVSAKQQPEAVPCWRTVHPDCSGGDTTESCEGTIKPRTCDCFATITSVYTSLPILLIVDVNQEDGGPEWNCPDRLGISQKTSTMCAVNYHLVSRVFHSVSLSHYVSRFRTSFSTTSRSSLVYEYDSMAYGGYAQEIPGGKPASHLAGTDSHIRLPDTFRTAVAVYQLQGGTNTQQLFLKHRLAQLSKLHRVQLSHETVQSLHSASVTLDSAQLVRVPDKDRFWLSSTRRYMLGTVDYDSTALPVAPLARTGHKGSRKLDSFWTKPLTETRASLEDPGGTQELLQVALTAAEDETATAIEHVVATVEPLDSTLAQGVAGANIDQANTYDQPPLAHPRGNSPFDVTCRCGASGEGNEPALLDNLDAIECDMCHTWSHISCQFRGRASMALKREDFVCDECDPRYVLGMLKIFAPGERRPNQQWNLRAPPLSQRLIPGRGALVKVGLFWYPARLLKAYSNESGPRSWRVKMWPLCEYKTDVTPQTGDLVPESDIRDELWGDVKLRRQTRLGKWRMASSIPDAESVLADPAAYPFTAEIDAVLRPHINTLIYLLTWKRDGAEDVPVLHDEEDIPVIGFVRHVASKSKVPAERQGLVVHTGQMSVKQRCQIMNWFDRNVPDAPTQRHLWMTGPPVAHAITLVLAERLKETYLKEKACPGPSHEEARRRYILKRTWTYQTTVIDRTRPRVVDVDFECLLEFERRLFERSKASGDAGFFQWGKDIGDLQDSWSPYDSGPSHWEVGDAGDPSEDLLKEGRNYVQDQVKPVETAAIRARPPRAQPKPRPFRRSKRGSGDAAKV